MIKVHHMILHVQRSHHDVANQLGCRRYRNADCILNGAHAGQCMHRGADAANALGDCPGIARVATNENLLKSANHCAGTVRVCDDAVFYHRFDAQVTFNTSYWIYDDACHRRL